eukprot:gene7499-5284_t
MFDHRDPSTFLNGRRDAPHRPLQAIVSPSLMVADQTKLYMDTADVLSPDGGGVEWLHVDVIDGHFAPNLSFCSATVRDLRRHFPHAFIDCHLMVTNPLAWIDDFAKAGASNYVFHIEATNDAPEVCRKVRAAGMQVGVAIKPATPVESLYPLIDEGHVDMILVMTVVPGFAGQSFMPGPLTKVRALRARYPYLNIQVDGSINLNTIEECAAAGANIVVPGQAVFKAKNRRENVNTLRETIKKHLAQGPVPRL